MAARRRGASLPRTLARRWQGALLVLVAVAVAVTAVVVPGYRKADLQLHDGSVAAVNLGAGLLGSVNTQIRDLSSASRMADTTFDVLQQGRTVVVKGLTSNQAQVFDPSTGVLGSVVTLPAAGEIKLNNGTAAVISRTNGSVWYGPAEQILALDFSKQKAQLDLGENALVVVTVNGNIIGLSLTRSEVVTVIDGKQKVTKLPLKLDPIVANVDLSAVGDRAVVLDRTNQRIWFEGSSDSKEMPNGSAAKLAAPSPQTSHMGGGIRAIVGTSTGVIGVADRNVTLLSTQIPQGEVGVPIVVGDCIYAQVGPRLATVCGGKAPTLTDIPDVPAQADLMLRSNRDAVILNDSKSGRIWLVNDGMRQITNWDKVSPPDDTTEEERDPNEETVKVDPNRDQQTPPVANPDELIAREGQTSELPVLDNDSDADGDMLVLSGVPDAGEGITFSLVRSGSGLQVAVAAGVTGVRTFSYTINDGRGGSATAQVNLTLESGDQKQANLPPVHWRDTVSVVARGSQTVLRPLLDWRDPDGDSLILKGASVVSGDDEVSFTPDGQVTFIDVNKEGGLKQIAVQVSDGVAVSNAIFTVDARKATDVPPVANGDIYSAATGQEIEVKPLLNDIGTNLTLASVDSGKPDGAKITVDYEAKSFRFQSQTPGVYYVGYQVSSGPSSYGLVRIDVKDKATENRPPVAARDVAVLTHGGSITIDPLLNDEDPDGDVLAIQTYGTNGLNVEMRDRHLLTISEISVSDEPVTLTYLISDGYHPAVAGTIEVIRSNAIGQSQPVTNPDEVNVRAGDVATVKPLRNDYSPVGLDLKLSTELSDNQGQAWVDGTSIKMVAPATPGRVTSVYQVVDTLGRTSSNVVTFNVISPDIGNQPPTPELVTGRLQEGAVTRIFIPLNGIDLEGDSVRLVGLASGPRFGRVVGVGDRYIDYEAFPGAFGTDAFQYLVADAFGAKAIGQIRVGIIPGSAINHSPTGADDTIIVRPGRTATVQPMLNDFDVDGDKIFLVPENPVKFDVPVTVTDDGAVEVPAPTTAKSATVGTYSIQDSRGSRGNGNIAVVADPDAPLWAPTAGADVVDVREVFQRDLVEVPVLDNDIDPDGSRSDLKLSVPQEAAAAGVTAENGRLRVPIGDHLRVFRYQVTDGDGLTAYGLVTVPGKADAIPTLKDQNMAPLEVVAGQELRVTVASYVQGTRGREIRVASADKVIGAPASGFRFSSTEVVYRPGPNDVGAAAISFEVTEDVDGSQTDSRAAVVTIPIKVLPRPRGTTTEGETNGGGQLNTPPSAPLIEIQVGAGEDPLQQNIRDQVTDKQGDSFSFESHTDQIPAGMRVSVSGSNLSISADIDAAGREGLITFVVRDELGATGQVSVRIVVVPTTRGRTIVGNDNVPDAQQGVPSIVDVLENDVSTLKDPTLRVVSASAESGGIDEVRVNNESTVMVTPNREFVGTAIVRYTVADATKDPGRNVSGSITLNVRGKPKAPGTPREVEVGNRQVTLTWTAAVDNGLTIDYYTVTASGNNGQVVRTNCPTTTCTITGLVNGVTYTFAATAHNELGDGPESPRSAEMVPDVAPPAPTLKWVQREPDVREGRILRLTVVVKEHEGTPITDYTVAMQGGGTRSYPATTADQCAVRCQEVFKWDGLTNGVNYTFTVVANNAAGPSQTSNQESGHPSGVPTVPLNLEVEDSGAALGGSLSIRWSAPADDNGDVITAYNIYRRTSNSFDLSDEPTAEQPVATSGGSFTYQLNGVENGEVGYVAVRAVNAAGPSDASVSAAVTAYGAPSISQGATAVEGDRKIYLTLPSNKVTTNGAAIDHFRFVATALNTNEVTGEIEPNAGNGFTNAVVNLPVANAYTRGWTVWVAPVSEASGGPPKSGTGRPSNQVVPRSALPPKPTIRVEQIKIVANNQEKLLLSYTVPDDGWNPTDLAVTGWARPSSQQQADSFSVPLVGNTGTATTPAYPTSETIRVEGRTSGGGATSATTALDPPVPALFKLSVNGIVPHVHVVNWDVDTNGTLTCQAKTTAPPYASAITGVPIAGGVGDVDLPLVGATAAEIAGDPIDVKCTVQPPVGQARLLTGTVQT